MITFFALALLNLSVGIICCYNAYLLYKQGRFQNIALAFFYVFSGLTLACNIMNLTQTIGRTTAFIMDLDLDADNCTHLYLNGLPSYLYAMTAYCYIINW